MTDHFGETSEAPMARVTDGNHTAFRRLVDRHVDRSIGLAERIIGDRAAAEDCVQEVFMTLWTKPQRYNPAKARFSTWLYRLIVNRSIDNGRRRKWAPLPEGFDVADDAMDGEARLEDLQRKHRLLQALHDLPERQRLAILLTYFEGHSNAEAAAILDCKLKALESLLSRARATLKDRLRNDALMMENAGHDH